MLATVSAQSRSSSTIMMNWLFFIFHPGTAALQALRMDDDYQYDLNLGLRDMVKAG
ncbi:MAG: hypothetical protein ACREEV_14070 [Dongiaceae bacterium]